MGLGSLNKLKFALFSAGINTVHVLKLRWAWVLGLTLLSFFLKQFFAQFSGNGHPEAETLRLVGLLGEMSVDLFISVGVLFMAPVTVIDIEKKRPLTSVWQLSHKHFYDLTVESLRVLTSVLLWALALILPGIYRSIQFSFYPFVVMFDEKYIQDEVDCLERSLSLIKEVFLTVFVVGLISLSLDTGLKASLKLFEDTMLQGATFGISLLTLVLSIYTLLVSFHLYRQQTGEEGDHHGTHV